MQFNLSPEKKIEAYQSVLNTLESGLILRLGVLGIDPDEFDEESFLPSEDSTAENDIYKIVCRIKEVRQKIADIQSA
jgi:hypothetical protein